MWLWLPLLAWTVLCCEASRVSPLRPQNTPGDELHSPGGLCRHSICLSPTSLQLCVVYSISSMHSISLLKHLQWINSHSIITTKEQQNYQKTQKSERKRTKNTIGYRIDPKQQTPSFSLPSPSPRPRPRCASGVSQDRGRCESRLSKRCLVLFTAAFCSVRTHTAPYSSICGGKYSQCVNLHYLSDIHDLHPSAALEPTSPRERRRQRTEPHRHTQSRSLSSLPLLLLSPLALSLLRVSDKNLTNPVLSGPPIKQRSILHSILRLDRGERS